MVKENRVSLPYSPGEKRRGDDDRSRSTTDTPTGRRIRLRAF